MAHKLAVLPEHCEREGRDYDKIEKTAGLALTSVSVVNGSTRR